MRRALVVQLGGTTPCHRVREALQHHLLDQLASPKQEAAGPADDLALEQLVDQLPAAQATALRLTVLEGLSLRQAASQLEISAMSVQRAQKKALEALRHQLVGAG